MSHRYRVTAKVACNPKCADKKCQECSMKTWKTSNLIKFAAFLDKSHGTWRWFNVYKYVKGQKGPQIGAFSTRSRPVSKWI